MKQSGLYFRRSLPPLAEQQEIVRSVGLLFENADAFRSRGCGGEPAM